MAIPHFLLGSQYAALGQFDKAEAALANAVLLAPSLHIARYQLGLLQFSSGRAAVALVTWEPLFSLEDAQPLGHFVRGFAALAQDEFAQAKAFFEAGLARNTENAALSHDIEKVLRGIEEAKQKQSGGSSGRSRPSPPRMSCSPTTASSAARFIDPALLSFQSRVSAPSGGSCPSPRCSPSPPRCTST